MSPSFEINTDSVIFLGFSHNPYEKIIDILNQISLDIKLSLVFVVNSSVEQPWADNQAALKFFYLVHKDNDGWIVELVSILESYEFFDSGQRAMIGTHEVLVSDNSTFFQKIYSTFFENPFQGFVFHPKAILHLVPVCIPKPWGQEIWYTGVEKRGVSKVRSSLGNTVVPLPWCIKACPSLILGEEFSAKGLPLIKILDPLPEEVFGDLYYEMHQEKNEVYIVTEIAPNCGQMKMGLNPEVLQEYEGNTQDFKEAFKKAIFDYKKVRNEIDLMFDDFRLQENLRGQEPIAVDVLKKWHSKLPKEILAKEALLRKEMDRFTGKLFLSVGDVIVVPTFVAHALQHGVKVVEFQTPTYERLIVSFAQKVLTQNHWDTEKALELMKLQAPQQSVLKTYSDASGLIWEEVCTFPDLFSYRIRLLKENPICTLNLVDAYGLIFVVSHHVQVTDEFGKKEIIEPGSCALLPQGLLFHIFSEKEASFLICSPKSIIV